MAASARTTGGARRALSVALRVVGVGLIATVLMLSLAARPCAAEGAEDAAAAAAAGVVRHGDVDRSPKCDSCRTMVEQFYEGWEKTITELAADGTFEKQPGGAPKITYNQEIEDFLVGFCESKHMKGYAPYITQGCRDMMKSHRREIVGKFLHEEEMMGSTGKRTMKPRRIRQVGGGGGMKGITAYCIDDSVPGPAVTARKDKCNACRGVVEDALFAVRRSWLGYTVDKKGVRAKRRLDFGEMLEPLCNHIFNRYDDEPEDRHSFCIDIMEEDEDAFLSAVLDGEDAVNKVCVKTMKVCKPTDLKEEF